MDRAGLAVAGRVWPWSQGRLDGVLAAPLGFHTLGLLGLVPLVAVLLLSSTFFSDRAM